MRKKELIFISGKHKCMRDKTKDYKVKKKRGLWR